MNLRLYFAFNGLTIHAHIARADISNEKYLQKVKKIHSYNYRLKSVYWKLKNTISMTRSHSYSMSKSESE